MPIAGSFQRGPAFGLRRVKGAVGKRLDILGQRGEPPRSSPRLSSSIRYAPSSGVFWNLTGVGS